MPKRQILRGVDIVDDEWIYLEDEAAPPQTPSSLLVGAERFASEAASLKQAGHRVGVRFAPHHSGQEAGDSLVHADLAAVEFPKFTDGRGYSIAQRLRTQVGWTGPLRALGDVLPDQVFYMRRVGFDELDVRADKSIEDAKSALGTFSVAYQGDAHDPRPLYRRRA